ncbi:TcpQ domain-containing protein [Cupriavidus necator]|uniref:hypothetical protein n=1 Tax=Cupriavidus necator TaxID=106590 RepID=UPI003ECE4FB7
MRPKLFSVRRSVAPIAGALALITNAHATYTVIDDDLYPTAMIQARSRSGTDWSADKFKVNFTKGSSSVGPLARPSVDDLIPRMQAASLIRIIGRPDSATATENKKQHSLGLARASALRTYLIRAGIPSDIIQVELDATGNPLASNGISQADIFISNRPDPRASAYQASAQIRAPQEPAIPHTYRYLNQEAEAPAARLITAPPAAAAPQAQASRNSSDERLIQYINQAVQTGQMLPSVAAQILRSLAEANTTTPQPVPAAAPAPQPAPAPTYAASVPAKSIPPRVERWVLDARLTLKENVDEWSKASGWRPTNWEAGNFYQVTSTTVLDGAFPDVLKRIADSTGLNICAMARDKYVRVTDSNVPCSK